jgi:RNA recognition motif-containing protein
METPARRCSLVDLTVLMQSSKKVPSINIYVGNLSFDTNEDQLKELFESYGQVESATIISDKFTGRPRGFGFVKMPEREEGLRAIQELDSRDFMGRSLKVNEARPRTDRPDRQGGGGRGGGGGSRWR